MKIGDNYLCVPSVKLFYYKDLKNSLCNISKGDIVTIINTEISKEGNICATEILVNNLKASLFQDSWLFFTDSDINVDLLPLNKDSVNSLLEDLNNQAIDIHKQINKLKINYELYNKD